MDSLRAWLVRAGAVLALGVAFSGTSLAQTTSETAVRKFELISVDGNKLVVRDEKGTQELTVPEDFRFTVDGKKLAAKELKPGMKGTATVTTKTTVTPVTVTEVKEADVLRATDTSVSIKGADGVSRRFTRGEVNARNIQLMRDGKEIRIGDLKKGDKLTAVIVTAGPPTVLTEKEVQVETEGGPAAAPTAAPASGAAATPPATTSASTSPAPAATPAPATPAPAPAAAPKPAEASGMGMGWWLLIILVIGAVLFFVMRGKK